MREKTKQDDVSKNQQLHLGARCSAAPGGVRESGGGGGVAGEAGGDAPGRSVRTAERRRCVQTSTQARDRARGRRGGAGRAAPGTTVS